jgi:hypothetical protein
MTQPQKREGTCDWFWWTAAHIFRDIGTYAGVLNRLKLQEYENTNYAPCRFVHEGEFNLDDVVRHFHACGLRRRDSVTHFRDFAKIYIASFPTAPREPNWQSVPTPASLTSRPTTSQRKRGRGRKSKQVEVKSTWGMPLIDRIADGGSSSSRAAIAALPYIEETPSGSTPVDPSDDMALDHEPQRDGSPMGPA